MRWAGAVVLGLGLAMPAPPSASAHGPCNCSFPQVGQPGARVVARSPAYKIVFNPRPADYGTESAATGYASAYRPGSPTSTVLSRPLRRPVRRASYRVPDVPPGVYLVLIFDGSEGGTHTTWDYFHVLGPAPVARSAAAARRDVGAEDDDGIPLGVLAGGILAGVLAGALGAHAFWKRRDAEAVPPM